jgi:ketosteroid isomerase-like protein
MQIIPTPITGTENGTGIDPAHAALITFYRAFNRRDLDLMEQVWLPGDEPSMDNPLGGIRRGWKDIRAGYLALFSGQARVYVEFYDYSLHPHGDTLLAVGRERGYCDTPAGRVELAIRTSRWFVRHDGHWRLLHHHGSIDQPQRLDAYQSAIAAAARTAP